MAVKIRLRRVGAKKQPSYRVIIAESRAPRDGRFIEIIGHYNPRTKPTTIVIDADKARKWIGQGAKPTESVASLLYRAGIVDMRSPRFKTDTAAAIIDAQADGQASEETPEPKAKGAATKSKAKATTPAAAKAPKAEAKTIEAAPVVEATPTAEEAAPAAEAATSEVSVKDVVSSQPAAVEDAPAETPVESTES